MPDKKLPLHTTVGNADEGDAGWVWYEGSWRLGMVMFGDDDEDDSLYVDLILPERSQWFNMADLKDLPWLPIPRPPYEGNEMPCTHAVTIMDRNVTLTFSWNANESDGKRMVQRITNSIEAMLRETADPVSVG